MRLPEYDLLDATGMAAAVHAGDLDPRELVDAAIDRIEARDGAVHAVVARCFEAARENAARIVKGAPFAGVPLLVKDLYLDVRGVPTRNGGRFYDAHVPTAHSTIVQRWLDAGFVILGKTAAPELGLGVTTEPEAFGPTRNPWNLEKSAGGSSGGSAASVAARLVPVATASDGGGSIRVPSACCGVFGLKPSRGRVPAAGVWAEQLGGLAIEHAVTRSVRDSAGILDFLSAPLPGAPYAAPNCARTFAAAAREPRERLRVGAFTEPVFPASIHPECVAAVDRTAALLRELGHEVVPVRLPVDGAALVQQLFLVAAGLTWAQIHDDGERIGRRPRARDFELETWTVACLGHSLRAGEFALAADRLKRTAAQVEPWMVEKRLDVLLCPTLAQPPWDLGALRNPGWARFLSRWLVGFAGLGRLMSRTKVARSSIEKAFSPFPFTPLFNMTGQPSMSVPLEQSTDGLPLGVMFSGRYGDEGTLLGLAAQLETARPWAERLPPAVRP